MLYVNNFIYLIEKTNRYYKTIKSKMLFKKITAATSRLEKVDESLKKIETQLIDFFRVLIQNSS